MSDLLGNHPGDGLHVRDEGGWVVAASGRVIGRRLVHLQQHKQTCEKSFASTNTIKFLYSFISQVVLQFCL